MSETKLKMSVYKDTMATAPFPSFFNQSNIQPPREDCRAKSTNEFLFLW